MYIENVVTPHPGLLQEGQQAAPIIEAAGLAEARAYLAADPSDDQARFGIVEHVTSHVRQSLRYPDREFMPKLGGQNEFDTLRNEQITTCLGYAAVASECLEFAGIDHYVSYAENHWMLAAPNANHTRLRLVDPLFKEANQDVTDYLSRGTPASIRRQVGTQRRGTAMLTSDCIYFPDEPPRDKEYINVLSFYAPEVGRAVMHSYSDFANAVTRCRFDSAAAALHDMRGIYPEVDARAPHEEIKRFVKDLCAAGDFEQATCAVDDYCVSFTPSKDARLKELEGDLLRCISKSSQDSELAERSSQAYEEALQRQRCGLSGKYEGKIRAAKELARQYSRVSIPLDACV